MTDQEKNAQPDQYVVVGNPVAHSRSPEIHQAFAAQFSARIEYRKVQVEPAGFAAFADSFKAAGGCGMNITVPFKADAFAYAEQADSLASAAGAVNTLVFRAGEPVQGFNTDGLGLIADLTQRHGLQLRGSRILLLGAGGAASGVVQPLLAAEPNELVVANRTLAKAVDLVAHHRTFCAAGAVLQACDFAELKSDFDLVINATSSGLSGATAPVDAGIVRDTCCYDMSYGAAAVFARWATTQGASKSIDGLGMLVEQAAESFYLWRGVRPATDPVMSLLRDQLQAQ